jgi:hypothetical protein
MPREEYTIALGRTLEPFSQETRDGALSFYGEMLAEKAAVWRKDKNEKQKGGSLI